MARSRNRSWGVAAGGLVATIAVVSGACGSGDDRTTAAEFTSKVNALCEAEHAEIDALFEDFPEEPTARDMQQLVVDFTPIIRQFRADVMEVGEPSDKQAEYRRYTELLDEAVERYEVAGLDAEKAQALFNEEDNRMAEVERKLGLDVCASR